MIEIFRYYLEIKNLKDLKAVGEPDSECNIEAVNPVDFHLNKFFYKQIGKSHRWTDRLSWADQTWHNYINNKNVKTFVLKKKSNLVGFFEQIFNKENNDYEIAYFGILDEHRNQRYGGYLLSSAIKLSLQDGARRVWVHTCSLDHKNAIKNYLARGMKIFKKEKVKISA